MGTVPFTHLFWVRPKTRVGLAICVTVENWNPSAETFTMLAPRAWRSCLPANRRSSLRTWQPQSLTRNWHTSGRVHHRSCLCPAASGRDPGSPCHSSLSLSGPRWKRGQLPNRVSAGTSTRMSPYRGPPFLPRIQKGGLALSLFYVVGGGEGEAFQAERKISKGIKQWYTLGSRSSLTWLKLWGGGVVKQKMRFKGRKAVPWTAYQGSRTLSCRQCKVTEDFHAVTFSLWMPGGEWYEVRDKLGKRL